MPVPDCVHSLLVHEYRKHHNINILVDDDSQKTPLVGLLHMLV
jgi:hypothetical protein